MELVSPDGNTKIDCHPTKVEWMLSRGWKDASKVKAKPAPKKEEKTEEEVE